MKKYLLIILSLLSLVQLMGQSIYAFDSRFLFNSRELLQEVVKSCQECKDLNGRDDLIVFPIYYFDDFMTHSRQDYFDGSFLSSLTPYYFTMEIDGSCQKRPEGENKDCRQNIKSTKTIIAAEMENFLVVDSCGNYLAQVDPLTFACYPGWIDDSLIVINSNQFLSEILYQHTLDYIFKVSTFDDREKPNVYFGVDMQNNSISVLIHSIYGVKIIPIEEIVDEHWEDFVNGLPIVKMETEALLKQEFEQRYNGIPVRFCY